MLAQKQYNFLEKERSPKVLIEALKLYGTQEIVGKNHNPVIMQWAKDLNLKQYTSDEIPWCGLFAAVVVKNAGYDVVKNPLWAANWQHFGEKSETAMLGDVLVFKRDGGGHVGFYVGEDKTCYHVLGGNQSNRVNITRVLKSRLTHIRRCPWAIGQPSNVRVIELSNKGQISTNEK